MASLGFLGPKGTFSDLAAHHWVAANTDYTPTASPSFFSLFEGLGQQLDAIIVPIENSIEGSVNATIDLLIGHDDYHIIDEVVVPVHHSLMATGAVSLDTIHTVTSHPQPLAQCQRYLETHLSHAQKLATQSTAKAASQLTDGSAVIGHAQLAEMYQLTVLASEIQGHASNVTRFVIVGSTATQPTGADKTSIVISAVQDQPGSLVQLLHVFADESINLTKIESRPTKESLGHYVFLIDFDGHQDDAKIRPVLSRVRQLASSFRWLGSYPKHVEP